MAIKACSKCRLSPPSMSMPGGQDNMSLPMEIARLLLLAAGWKNTDKSGWRGCAGDGGREGMEWMETRGMLMRRLRLRLILLLHLNQQVDGIFASNTGVAITLLRAVTDFTPTSASFVRTARLSDSDSHCALMMGGSCSAVSNTGEHWHAIMCLGQRQRVA